MSGIFDAAIVGGGPAGCSAAITLAQQGAKVALFEARNYPHHKVCGEFLSPECTHFLQELGVAEPLQKAGLVEIRTARITAPGGTTWDTPFPSAGWGITRSTFDAALAARARALAVDVREATTVMGIDGNLRDGFTLTTRSASSRSSMRARTVIGAHGKRSNVDRVLERRFLNEKQPFIALKNHFYGPPLRDRIELHGFSGGYCGMSEVEGGLTNVCLLAHQRALEEACGEPIADLTVFVNWMQEQNPYLGEWLSQATPVRTHWLSIAQVPFVTKGTVVNDVLMVGDAARLIVPLAGDGIAMAIHSGQIAGECVGAFFQGRLSAETLRSLYAKRWRKSFRLRLRVAGALQIMMLRPYLLAVGLQLLNRLPWVGEYLVRTTRDVRFVG